MFAYYALDKFTSVLSRQTDIYRKLSINKPFIDVK